MKRITIETGLGRVTGTEDKGIRMFRGIPYAVTERFELPVDEAIALMQEKNEPYKIELIQEHADKGEAISFYKQGEFTELCAGPHLDKTGHIKHNAFKLISNNAA